MTTTIQNLSDLQDRRIMMDKKLPPYGYAFVILTGLFMIFLVIWSTQTNRIYVSQNSGVVQAANKTYIMSSYSGSITELYVSEGSYVNAKPAGYLPEATGPVQQAAQVHSGRHQLF